MKIKILLISALLSIFVVKIIAQDSLIYGEWVDLLNYRESKWVTQSKENVFISTGRALITINKADLEPKFTSRIDGLNETVISKIVYNTFHKQLYVLYNSGAFDVLDDEEIIYNSAIRDNSNISGVKRANDAHITKEGDVFFAHSFGILQYDGLKDEFKSTTFTGTNVHTVSSDDLKIYIGTDKGIYSINKSSTAKENFSLWNYHPFSSTNTAPYKCSILKFFAGQTYAAVNNNLYRFNASKGMELIPLQIKSDFNLQWLSADGAHLLIGLKDGGFQSSIKALKTDGTVVDGGADCINRTIYGIEDEKGRIWYADDWRMIRYTNNISGGCNKIEYPSPYGNPATNIDAGADKTVFASGGATETYQIDYSRNGVYVLNKDGSWININEEYHPILNQKGFMAYYTAAIHPKKRNLVYMGSYLNGLAEYNLDDKTFKFYSEKNAGNGTLPSSLQSIVGAPGQVRVTNLKFDKNDNLWLANFGAPRPISVFTKEGTWYSFPTTSNTLVTRIAIDNGNTKWCSTFDVSPGVLVFNENNTLADPTDDKVKVLNSANSKINAQVNCVEVDLEGDIWVGTSEGPITFSCDPFSDKCKGDRIIVSQDSILANLLETEEIFCIEVDGANNKWFGTRNGLFVQSPDGKTQLAKFTIKNSPLLANQIIDLDYDGTNGLMYISTTEGIQYYKTATTNGAKNLKNSTSSVFPNPVRPGYNGPITITGLTRDANVKITDISGKMVYQGTSDGGLFIWDGKDYTNLLVPTGVYLVFASNTEEIGSKDFLVTKITIVR
jgi:hypothetical protein